MPAHSAPFHLPGFHDPGQAEGSFLHFPSPVLLHNRALGPSHLLAAPMRQSMVVRRPVVVHPATPPIPEEKNSLVPTQDRPTFLGSSACHSFHQMIHPSSTDSGQHSGPPPCSPGRCSSALHPHHRVALLHSHWSHHVLLTFPAVGARSTADLHTANPHPPLHPLWFVPAFPQHGSPWLTHGRTALLPELQRQQPTPQGNALGS